ncbi:unnamed protein product [Trichobilharzia szidati]|nr:unnamed protein product [Trichobilharzia szidati]
MFNSIYIYISMITLLVFATMNEGESTRLEDIKNAISYARNQLLQIAQMVIRREAATKQLKDKIILETGGKGNSTIENYISCWGTHYENYFGHILFEEAKNGPEDYGTFTVKHSLRQCMKKEANAHTGQWRSVSAAVDCEHYKPSGNKKDLQELKSNIEISYRRRMLFGNIMLLKKIHETLAEKLTRVGGRN